MRLIEAYSRAVNSTNLTCHPDTVMADVDVLAAMGLAGRKHALGAALLRLFVDGKVRDCVQTMTAMVMVQVSMPEHKAREVAQKVLAWYRFGTCTECGGTGKEIIIEPKPHLSEDDCPSCCGTGKRPFNPNFKRDEIEVALWLKDMVEREQEGAAVAAMRRIAPNLNLDL